MVKRYDGSTKSPDLDRKTIERFVITFVSLGGATWTGIEAYGYFFGTKPLAGTGVVGVVLVVVGSAFVASMNVIFYLYKRLKNRSAASLQKPNRGENMLLSQVKPQRLDTRQSINSSKVPVNAPLKNALISEIKIAHQRKRWEDVIRFGNILSRPLWVTGEYNLRVEIGKLVADAAAHSGRIKEQAFALIDDLGWTNHVLGNSGEAKRNIQHGIRLAQENDEYFLVQKGYRHLSGIAIDEGNLEEARVYLEKAKEFAMRINDVYKRKEAIAGLHVNEALIEVQRRNWEKALDQFRRAQDIYRDIGDRARERKVYHLIALYHLIMEAL